MVGYNALAGCYDGFTRDVNYSIWADYVERHFARRTSGVNSVLDLACGTGSLTWLLAERGYEMIGVDLSPEMLAQAMEKAEEHKLEDGGPIFLCQPMEQLDLYGTVDACVCMLDSVNHVTRPSRLARAFQRVHLFLEPGGLFLFDILTPSHLEGLDGELFLDETEDAYCVWRTEFDQRRRICTYGMDIFQREGAHWLREEEVHKEFAYTVEELTGLLEDAGFCQIRQHGDLIMNRPREGSRRIFFSAWKKG